MKFLKGVSILVVVLFLSSCKQSFLSSKYNHLEKVERTGSSSEKTYSSRPLLKKKADSVSIELASSEIIQDTLNEFTASIENDIQLSSTINIKSLKADYAPADSISAKKKPLLFRKIKDLSEEEKLSCRKKSYIFSIIGFLLLLAAGVLIFLFYSFTWLGEIGVVLFFLSPILLIIGLFYFLYAKESLLQSILLIFTSGISLVIFIISFFVMALRDSL
jgi:hypothetical protein